MTQLFVLTAFPIHLWMIINMLFDVPSWLIYLRAGEILGMIAYNFGFALIETAALYLPILVLGILFPKRWTAGRYVPVVSACLVAATGITFALQLSIYYDWPKMALLASVLPIFVIAGYLALRYSGIARFITALTMRLTVLTIAYVSFDLVGLLIVIARNV